jgi:acetyl esterase/lipase
VDRLNKNLFEALTKDSFAPADASYTQEEIIYGRKYGMALTMLRLKPKSKTNGRSIILLRSGGWGSTFYMPNVSEATPFLKSGYTVFIVFHGSEPIYTVVDAVEDVQRAVRYIRYHAKSYLIEVNKIGIMGVSAGGHLALMCGLSDFSDVAYSPDPIDRVSSKVNAVVSFSPSVDFLNWDGKGNNARSAFLFEQFLVHVLEFRNWDVQRRRFTYVKDSVEINKILTQISPTYHVSANDAPVLVFHGDQDELVPISQLDPLVSKLRDAQVPVLFSVKRGEGHGWPRTEEETKMILNWFARYLK